MSPLASAMVPKAGKSVLLSELQELASRAVPDRLHHHTRRKGGHHAEIEYWIDRLQTNGFPRVDALRAIPFSPRVYFLLGAPPDIRHHAERIAVHWGGLITWHPGARRGETNCLLTANTDG